MIKRNRERVQEEKSGTAICRRTEKEKMVEIYEKEQEGTILKLKLSKEGIIRGELKKEEEEIGVLRKRRGGERGNIEKIRRKICWKWLRKRKKGNGYNGRE